METFTTEDMMILNSDMWDKLLKDEEAMRSFKLAFAKVGVFNPRTLLDDRKDRDMMLQGKIPKTGEQYWQLDKYLGNPLHCYVVTKKLFAKNRANWTITDTMGCVKITPHAFGRYRERTGTFIDLGEIANIVHLPLPCKVKITDDHAAYRTDYLLPFKQGAFLGWGAFGNGSVTIKQTYKKRQFKMTDPGTKLHTTFNAITYITDAQMSVEQLRICDAYRKGDIEKYQQLSETSKNPKYSKDTHIIKITEL